MLPGAGVARHFRIGARRLFVDSGAAFITRYVEEPLFLLVQASRFANWQKQQNLPTLADRQALYAYVVDNRGLTAFDYLEFGVYQGTSMRWWVRNNPHPDATFTGFDTFTGLPEDWGVHPAGTYTTNGTVPDIDDPRCTFRAGLFQDTLPRESISPGRPKVIHLDADLYSSTLYVLTVLARHLGPGDVLIFDEFCTVRNEFRAFQDFCAAFRLALRPMAQTASYAQIAFVID